MWSVNTQSCDWPGVLDLTPVRVLDEYDGPRLFTIKDSGGHEFLVYQCAEDPERDRFLITPARNDLINDVEANRISLRDAITSGWLWMADRLSDGSVTQAVRVDAASLPAHALPKLGTRLNPTPDVLLRIRMIGPRLSGAGVPANVVKRTAEGAMNAVKALATQVLNIGSDIGRPAENLRRYYDLPALSFVQNSFQIEFGYPKRAAQLELQDEDTIGLVGGLFKRGLDWALSDNPSTPSDPEWGAIIEALSKITPPQHGDVVSVEVSGDLVGKEMTRPVVLDRSISQKISAARLRVRLPNPNVILNGLVREFDKDKFSFILRDEFGNNLRQVFFSEDAYDDALLAFNSDVEVTVILADGSSSSELVSIGPHIFGEQRTLLSQSDQ